MTQTQSADVRDKAKSNREAAGKAVRDAWNHILYPVPSDVAGTPFALDHSQVTAREREAIPSAVYDKVKADGIALEKLGSETLWLKLEPLWPDDRAHLPVSEIAEWFASFVYLPRIRDRVVLEQAIRDAVGKLDAAFRARRGFWGLHPPDLGEDAARDI